MGSIAIDTSILVGLDQDQPVVMLNLLRYRDKAAFSKDSAHEPCSGSEAYGMYAKATMPLVEKIPVKIVYAGHSVADLIVTTDEHWDDVLIVEYPSVSSFIALMNNPVYQETLYLRTAALSSSRLIAMQDGLVAQA